jgi:hypothetical protein
MRAIARETVLANTLTPTLSRLREREQNYNCCMFCQKIFAELLSHTNNATPTQISAAYISHSQPKVSCAEARTYTVNA